ncbi:uncharacterized protein LOC143203455 isoform X2 [Rhynchophorus ferrugineus]|uniref:uncharacterized protein LOC143203455 isoform X2 n=1 Tax=Rhynchophorus ferrugineus TaxID=354439 RepID=UPI003FCD2F50
MFYYFGEVELILQEQSLVPCHVCGRTFLPNSLKKHEKVCEKNAIKKRKPFDSLKQRVSGTDLADFHQKSYLKKKEEPIVEKKPRQSKWKEKHLELMTAIRVAKGIPEQVSAPGSPTAKPRSTTSLLNTPNEQCPSCDRFFGPKAFDRHVEWCKEKKARIQQSPASVQQAKERLEARIKYRVPPLNKSKRATVRDKYSPNGQSSEPPFPRVTASTTNLAATLSRTPSIRKPKSLHNVDKYTHESKPRPDKLELNRSGGDKRTRVNENERKTSTSPGVPIIGSPSSKSDSLKSLSSKRSQVSLTKLNNTNINEKVHGLTVSPLNYGQLNKRMVTWKDSVMTCNEGNLIGQQNNSTSEETDIFKALKSEFQGDKSPSNKFQQKLSKSETTFKKPIATYKIISSSDVLHKQKELKIPTKKIYKSISKVFKKSQQNRINEDKSRSNEEISESTKENLIDETDFSRDIKSDEKINAEFDINHATSSSVIKSEELAEKNDQHYSLCEQSCDKLKLGESYETIDNWFEHSFSIKEENSISEIKGNDNEDICKLDETKTPQEVSETDSLEDSSIKNSMKSLSDNINQDNNVVCLFKSSDNSDFMKTESLNTLTLQTSWNTFESSDTKPDQKSSQDTIADSTGDTRSLVFSLKKSLSDINVSTGCALKKSFVSLFTGRRTLNDSDSVDFRRTFQDIRSSCSAPNIYIREYKRKVDNNVNWDNVKKKERLEILRIAAERFIEDSKRKYSGITENFDNIPDEEYTVPKKKRRVYLSDDTITSSYNNEPYKTESNTSITKTRCSTSSNASGITPRTFHLVKKVVIGKQLKEKAREDILLAMTLSECEKLLKTDASCLEKVKNKLNKDRSRIHLPLLFGDIREKPRSTDKQVQAKLENVSLPKLNLTQNYQNKQIVGKIKNCNASNYDPFEVAQRQFMELLECDDFKPSTPTQPTTATTTTTPRPRTTPLKSPSPPSAVKQTSRSADSVKKPVRDSVIEPPISFKDSLDSVNDDFELIENMINERFGNDEIDNNNGGFYLHNIKNNGDAFMFDQLLDSRKFSDDLSGSIDSCLINENDNLSIPDNLKIDDCSPTSTVNTDGTLTRDDRADLCNPKQPKKLETLEPKAHKKPLVKRSLSLVNRTKRDTGLVTNSKPLVYNNNKNNTLANKTVSKGSKNISSVVKVDKTEKKKTLPLLKRSMTLVDPSPKPSFKNKKEVNDYFSTNEQKVMSTSLTSSMISNMTSSVTENKKKSSTIDILKAEDLFSVDDEMFEEYKKYEEMYLKEKEQKSTTKKTTKKKTVDLNYGIFGNEEEDHSNNSVNKLSNDSAYGSLRKNTKQRSRAPKLSPLEAKTTECGSSSSSENGSGSPAAPSFSPKVSKFCHECGTKFPVSTAKFCVECGVKRLVL